jgi:hypothetical protein
MTRPQGRASGAALPIARMCTLADVNRAGYYRAWEASTPRQEETALRDVVQRLALAHRHTAIAGSRPCSGARAGASTGSACCA